jgi:hypothetical protein
MNLTTEAQRTQRLAQHNNDHEKITFYNPEGELKQSLLVPNFPHEIKR